MASRTLYDGSDIATQSQNTTGVMTRILTIDPDQGTKLVFKNRVDRGTAAGLPIFFEPKDGSDQDLPVDTEMVLQAKMPGDNQFRNVSRQPDNIATYLNKTISEQQNDENIDSTKIELEGEEVHIRDVDEFAVAIKSSAQIDWSNSELYFYEGGVEERQRED